MLYWRTAGKGEGRLFLQCLSVVIRDTLCPVRTCGFGASAQLPSRCPTSELQEQGMYLPASKLSLYPYNTGTLLWAPPYENHGHRERWVS